MIASVDDDASRSGSKSDVCESSQYLATGHGLRRRPQLLTNHRAEFAPAVDLAESDVATKNDDGRVVYLTPELKSLLASQLERVEALQRLLGRIIPHLFPHLAGRHRGKQIRDFRKAWMTACKKAGVTRRLRHDFRRVARKFTGITPSPEVHSLP